MKKLLFALLTMAHLVGVSQQGRFETIRAEDIRALPAAAGGDDTLNLVSLPFQPLTVNDTLLQDWVGSKLDTASFGSGSVGASGIFQVSNGSGGFNASELTYDATNNAISTNEGSMVLNVLGNDVLNLSVISSSWASSIYPASSFLDLGLSNFRWRNAYIQGTLTLGSSGTDYSLPTADGTNGQVLQTDGTGNVTFQTVSSGASSIGVSGNLNVANGLGGFQATSLTASGRSIFTLSGNLTLSPNGPAIDISKDLTPLTSFVDIGTSADPFYEAHFDSEVTTGPIRLKEQSSSPLSDAATVSIYANNDVNQSLYYKNDLGDEVLIISNATQGTTLPSVTGVTNVTTVTGVGRAIMWQRQDDTVSFSGVISVTATTGGGSLTEFRVDIPYASNFTSIYDAVGTVTPASGNTFIGGNVSADITNDALLVEYTAAGTTATDIYISGMYEIK